MVSNKEKELIVLKMGMNMRVNFTIIIIMVTEFIIGKMVINMREIG
jgi:hypothetical protein